MTEHEWLTSSDPQAMLRVLRTQAEGLALGSMPSPRKLRLFACACARQVWQRLPADSRKVVAGAEKYADDGGDIGELYGLGELPVHHFAPDAPEHRLASACLNLTWLSGNQDVSLQEVLELLRPEVPSAVQAALLRDVVGNPFRPVTSPMPEHAAVRSDLWGMAYGIAREAYDERLLAPPSGRRTRQQVLAERMHAVMGGCCSRFADNKACDCLEKAAPDPDGRLDPVRLSVLADALEEAGCIGMECPGHRCHPDNRLPSYPNNDGPETCGRGCGGTGRLPHQLLAHLRSPGPHVRGCWAIDLILGKN